MPSRVGSNGVLGFVRDMWAVGHDLMRSTMPAMKSAMPRTPTTDSHLETRGLNVGRLAENGGRANHMAISARNAMEMSNSLSSFVLINSAAL